MWKKRKTQIKRFKDMFKPAHTYIPIPISILIKNILQKGNYRNKDSLNFSDSLLLSLMKKFIYSKNKKKKKIN